MKPILLVAIAVAGLSVGVSAPMVAQLPTHPPRQHGPDHDAKHKLMTPAEHEVRHQAGDSAAVVAVVSKYHEALAAGDSAGVLALLAADAVILETGGVETRDEYRAHHLPGDINFARAIRSQRGPVHVRIRGDVAWTTATSTTQGEMSGRAINSIGAELMVLVREAGEWKISAIHWSSRNRRPSPE